MPLQLPVKIPNFGAQMYGSLFTPQIFLFFSIHKSELLKFIKYIFEVQTLRIN